MMTWTRTVNMIKQSLGKSTHGDVTVEINM